MEDPKTQYGIKIFIVWDDVWVGIYLIYMYQLTEPKITKYNSFKLKNN